MNFFLISKRENRNQVLEVRDVNYTSLYTELLLEIRNEFPNQRRVPRSSRADEFVKSKPVSKLRIGKTFLKRSIKMKMNFYGMHA